jgi:hypothetical protein
MWPRVAELMIGLWLVLSPLIFRNTEAVEQFAAVDVSAGAAVVILSLLSFWHRAEWAHLGTARLALGLGAFAYFAWERPGPPAAQNEIFVALLLLLLAIIPNEASQPPKPWRRRSVVPPLRAEGASDDFPPG